MSASSSSPRPASSCAHFGTCGGCALQHLPYEEQLAAKAAKVLAALAPIKEVPKPAVHASPQTRYYRNKMEFSFGDVYPPVPGGPTVKLGLKPKGRWYEILDLQECRLLSPQTAPLLVRVRAWAEAEKVPPYNGHKKSGLLRHLVLREGKNTGERMAVLVTAPGAFPEASFLKAVEEAYPGATVLHGINGTLSDTVAGAALRALSGPGHITELLRFGARELRFRISPHSFFQTNTGAANLLYALLRDWVREAGADTVLDLYCGGGGIALSIADSCRKAVGVESCAPAVADAKANAELNGIRNADFYYSSTEFLLPALLAMEPQAVVCDPPRAGMHAAARALLAEKGPRTMIYVSCNPESLARDLKAMTASYALERLEVFDLFPHTEHVESVALLRRRR